MVERFFLLGRKKHQGNQGIMLKILGLQKLTVNFHQPEICCKKRGSRFQSRISSIILYRFIALVAEVR